MAPTLVIVDDHQMIRAGLSAALTRQGGFSVVAQASTGAEAISAVCDHQPDVVILDMCLPDMAGFTACQQIVDSCRETAVLMIATDDWDVCLTQAYASGAAGFLAKELTLESLIQAVNQVANGKTSFTPQQHQRIQQWQTNIDSRLSSLTDREQDVFWAIIQYQTNSEIAANLHISIRTVESHSRNILQKLDLSSRRDLRRWAVENHLMVMHV